MFQKWDSCLSPEKVAKLSCIPIVFGNIVAAFLLFAGTVAVFMLAWGSLTLIRSGGDAKQVAAGRQIMTYAIIGLILVLSSFAIVYFIGYITKSTDCITNLKSLGDGTGGCQ